MEELQHILAQLERAKDPIEVIRAKVMQDGSQWVEPGKDLSGIFEIQLSGLVGIGPTVPAAVDDWILQAKARARSKPCSAA